ncbi:hypothetical protein WJX72_011170 [[Myrmecia] bisecta]|uniref:Uncharacterized protein n=1 Tax=[Myrmecia] bisecta TaxID=41462 RepID=A0AAW1PMH3_9CHLO
MVVRGFAGAPESDEVVTFEDILSGVLGDHEAELAKQLHAAAYIQPQLQVVDASSNDMRALGNLKKSKRV